MGCVLNEDASHTEDIVEIDVVADNYRSDVFTVHQAERSENHGETEGDETETTD